MDYRSLSNADEMFLFYLRPEKNYRAEVLKKGGYKIRGFK
jgi:hypothetical protein